MTWNEVKPEASDFVRDTGALLREHKGSIDTWLQQTFYWSDSTSSAGVTRLSTVTGGLRAFVGTYSALSSNETGTFFLASDTRRLYALSLATGVPGTVLVGSAPAILAHTPTKIPTDQRWLVQGGHEVVAGEGADALTFPIAYGAPPTLLLTPSAAAATDGLLAAASVVTAGGATVILARTLTTGPDPGGGYYWRSEGTTTL